MDRLASLESKADKIQEDVSDIKVTMAVNTAHLEAHMARTAAVEKTNELIQEQVYLLREELKPVEKHVLLVNYTIVLIGAITAGILTIWGIYEVILKIQGLA